MRPFFSYYGAKYTTAKYLGSPRHACVIEPFAGSACYSLRWDVQRAFLYDVSDEICDLWDFLISCSDQDIYQIPDAFEDFSEIECLSRGASLLVRFWIAKGRSEPSGTISPWYQQYRNSVDCRVWGSRVKHRILAQKPLIANWKIDNLSWEKIPLREAHWHIDPPYNNGPGSRYPHSAIDFNSLARWCNELPGHVDVCENQGATWLPFEELCEVVSSRGRRDGHRSKEVVFRKFPKGGAEMFDDLLG